MPEHQWVPLLKEVTKVWNETHPDAWEAFPFQGPGAAELKVEGITHSNLEDLMTALEHITGEQYRYDKETGGDLGEELDLPTGEENREEKKPSGNARLYQMLDMMVPAPFLEEQEMPLRNCTRSDLENAVKVLQATQRARDGSTARISFLNTVLHEFRGHFGSSRATVDEVSFRGLETLAIKWADWQDK